MIEKTRDCRSQQITFIVRVQCYGDEMSCVRIRSEPIATDYNRFLFEKMIKPSELLVRSIVK